MIKDSTLINAIIFGSVFAAFYFVLQLCMCIKARKVSIKLIPIYIISIGIPLYFIYAFDLFGENNSVWNKFLSEMFTVSISVITGLSYAGVALAWLTYLFIRLIKRRKNSKHG